VVALFDKYPSLYACAGLAVLPSPEQSNYASDDKYFLRALPPSEWRFNFGITKIAGTV
jgi:hypothetical protein